MATSPVATPQPRKLGRWMTTSLVVGTMIGSGIFLLPSTLAPLGWNAIFGWLLTVGGALCLAAVFAWLAREMPREGGPYAYTTAAFGPLTGHMVCWSYWIAQWVGNGAIAVAAVAYLSVFVPAFAANQALAAAASVAIVWGLIAFQMLGARATGSLQLFTTLLKLLPLLAVIAIAVGVLAGGADPLPGIEAERPPVTAAALTAAATLTLWALIGLESATVPAERIEAPERTIPFATVVGTAVTGLIYIATCSAIILLMPVEQLAASNAPFADFVGSYWGDWARGGIALFAAISCIGALNGLLLIQGELPYAMAKGGTFPRFFAAASGRGVPVRSAIFSAALTSLVIMLNYAQSLTALFTFIILLSTAAMLFMYLACALALLRLSLGARLPRARLLEPIAAIAALYSLWTIYGAGGEAVAWGLALLAAGAPVYFLTRRGEDRLATA